ncbi:hypothetical protein, partial [Mycobacteroides abscessus]|uniref:hypothetical protein n=1 Tax=Mycobacteroides abscessus TaxID=36809 RepID=UPI000C25C84F
MIIHNKGEYVRHIGVRLIPGVNKILSFQKEQFEEALKHPLNKYLVDSGEIVIIEGEKKEKADTFASLNAEKAIDLVKDTHVIDTLNQFLKEEEEGKKRKTVIEAIQEQ